MTRSDPPGCLGAAGAEGGTADRQRADKWLWHARFFKTRRLAADLLASGRVRVNGAHITKASAALRPGDTLTFPQGGQIRVVRVRALASRRGPAVEARALYDDLCPSEPTVRSSAEAATGQPPHPARGGARPTKKDRRKADLSRGSLLE